MGISRIGTSQHQGIGIRHLLLLVCQDQELLIDLVKLLFLEIHTVDVEPMLQGSPSAAGCQYDRVVVDTHILGVHDLIGVDILQHTILMDAAGMSEGITTYNSLIRLYRHIHQRRHHPARGIDLRGVDIRLDADGLMTFQDHGDLLERGVTSPFADTVDGHLHLSGSG